MTEIPGRCDVQVTRVPFAQVGTGACDMIRTMHDNVGGPTRGRRIRLTGRPGRPVTRRPLVRNGYHTGAPATGGDR